MSMRSRLLNDGVDPPMANVVGGNSEDRAPAEPAADGGIGGFLNHATAWDVMAGQPQCMTELADYLAKLDDSPDLRAAATLRSLSRIRTELERIPESCGLGDPVALKVQDVVLLARQLMSRLR